MNYMYNDMRNLTQIITNLVVLLLHYFESLSKEILELQHFPAQCLHYLFSVYGTEPGYYLLGLKSYKSYF